MRERYLTRAEAANMLRVSQTTIDNYRRGGKLTRYTGANDFTVLFRLSELEALSTPRIKETS